MIFPLILFQGYLVDLHCDYKNMVLSNLSQKPIMPLLFLLQYIIFVFYSRHDSGGSIFMRRMDYSSFNVLPKQKINSYHIKMEDECSIGNDETRIFILSNLASNKLNKVPCVLCNSIMTVFDRYPLIDGTFFLSPRQHNRTCVQVSSIFTS